MMAISARSVAAVVTARRCWPRFSATLFRYKSFQSDAPFPRPIFATAAISTSAAAAPATATRRGRNCAPTNNCPFHLLQIRALSDGFEDVFEGEGNPAAAEFREGWQIINTGYSTLDMVVAAKVMTPDLLPDDPAQIDCSKAFNRAFEEVSSDGGGTVYAPEGVYLFTRPLEIPQNVVLRGAWGSMSGSDKSVRGTVLKVTYKGKFTKDDPSFVQLHPRAGLRDLTIWYPEQNLDDITPYASTIGGAVEKPDEIVIVNVNLVNSYVGLQANGNFKRTYCNGLYGSPLKLGMFQESSSDVPFYSQVHFSADYWSKSGLPGAPSRNDLRKYLKKNATGIKIAASDNIFASEWQVEGYKIGLHFVSNEEGGEVNGNMYGLRATDCKTALLADSIGPTFIINSVFKAAGDAVRVNDANQAVGLFFNNSSFKSSNGGNAFNFTLNDNRAKNLKFQNCSFDGGPLIAGATNLSVVNSTFSYTDGEPIVLSKKTDSALLAGNSFAYDGDPVDLNGARPRIVEMDKRPTFSESLKPFDINGYKKTRKPNAENLIVIGEEGYEARVNGKTDDAPVIQRAMDDIHSQGGGIVLVPQISEDGYAIRSQLTVPEGVELRSSAEGLHSFNKRERIPGALLQVYHGRNDNVPTIILNKGSGFKGFTVHYPKQMMNSIVPYSKTIRITGNGAYVMNNQFLNSYELLDIVDSDDHLVENNMIQPVNNTIRISNCKNGRFNHNNIRGEWDDSGFPTVGDLKKFEKYTVENNIVHRVLNSQNQQFFACFSRVSKRLAEFKNSTVHSLQFSMEACQNGIAIDGISSAGSVELIGSSLRTDRDVGGSLTMFDVATDSSDGPFRAFSTLCSGYPGTLFRITDADTNFQNGFVRLDRDPTKIRLVGTGAGVTRIENSAISRYEVSATIKNEPGKRLEMVGSEIKEELEYSLKSSQIADTVDPSDLSDSIRLARVANKGV